MTSHECWFISFSWKFSPAFVSGKFIFFPLCRVIGFSAIFFVNHLLIIKCFIVRARRYPHMWFALRLFQIKERKYLKEKLEDSAPSMLLGLAFLYCNPKCSLRWCCCWRFAWITLSSWKKRGKLFHLVTSRTRKSFLWEFLQKLSRCNFQIYFFSRVELNNC